MAVGRESNKVTLEIDIKNLQNQTLTDEDRQLLKDFKTGAENMIKKGTSDNVLLANGETISKEELKGQKGDTGERGERGEQGQQGAQGIAGKSAYQIALDNGFQGTEAEWLESLNSPIQEVINEEYSDDKIELRFYQKNIQWKLKKDVYWNNLLYNYDVRELDNQVLIGRVLNGKIEIKLPAEPETHWRHLLLGQSFAFNLKTVGNQIQWKSNNANAKWELMPLVTTDAADENKTFTARFSNNHILYRENTSSPEKTLILSFPNDFHIKMIDHLLMWKLTTEDDSKWKFLPFHNENHITQFNLESRIHNGIIQYKFHLQENWTDLFQTKHLIPTNEAKIVSKNDIVGDVRLWMKILFKHHTNIVVKSGTYEFDVISPYGVMPLSNSKILFENGCIWKLKSSTLPTFYLLHLNKVNNVTIQGGDFIGDKFSHIYPNVVEDNRYYRSEQVHGMVIEGCTNINISNMNFSNFIGDGMLLSKNVSVKVKDVFIDNARMECQGMPSGENITFENCIFQNASPDPNSPFKNLGYGTDIEPFENSFGLKNIKYINCVWRNNEGFLPVGFMLSLYGNMRQSWVNGVAQPLKQQQVTIELINPIFEGCGLTVASANDYAVGYLKVYNPTFINTKRFAIYLRDHVGANFSTYVYNPKLINCGVDSNNIVGIEKQFIAPISFWVNANEAGRREINPNVGTKNVFIYNSEIITDESAAFKKFAIQNYVTTNATNNKANDLKNVVISDANIQGYEDLFFNESAQGIDASFVFSNNANSQIVSKSENVTISKDMKNTRLDVSAPADVLIKNDISVSNSEYYIRNSSTGEVKLKFEAATDIEGLAYGVQEYPVARGKKIKLRKIDANRWDYLEGTV